MFGLLVLVGLFVALTPGILFKLKGSKNVSAAMHAVLFGLVVYVVSVYFVSIDGFTSMLGETLDFIQQQPVLASPLTPVRATFNPEIGSPILCRRDGGRTVGTYVRQKTSSDGTILLHVYNYTNKKISSHPLPKCAAVTPKTKLTRSECQNGLGGISHENGECTSIPTA